MLLKRRDFGKLAFAAGALTLAGPRFAFAQGERPEVRIAVEALWQSMAPVAGISNASQRIFPNFYDRLVERDYASDPSGLTLIPKLATAWERNENVWTFTVREGVKFHNGDEMTAEDVAFTLSSERLWGENAYEPRGKTFAAGFTRVEATGPYTVEIETEIPDANIPGKLCGYIGMVVPKKHYLEVGLEAFGLAPVGAGPYKVTTFRADEVMVLEAFEEYWGDAAPASSLTFQLVPEYAGRVAGLASGEFDFITSIPTDQEPQLEGMDGFTLVRKPSDAYVAFSFNTLPDPVDNPLVDPKLRYAMVQALDMDTIVKALYGDATFHPAVPFNFPEYGKFYDPDAVSPLPYDPEAARALVAETGYKGETLIWHITKGFYANYDAAAEIMVEMWREIGVNVEAQFVDNFQLAYERPFHLLANSVLTTFIPGDPYQPLWLDWGPTSGAASAAWKLWEPSPEFLDLGNRFAAATEFEERKALYEQLSAEWQRVTPAVYMWKVVNNWAHKDGIEWTPIPAMEMRMYGDYLKFS